MFFVIFRDLVVHHNVHYGSVKSVVLIMAVGILPIVTVDDHTVLRALVNRIALCVTMVLFVTWGCVNFHHTIQFYTLSLDHI